MLYLRSLSYYLLLLVTTPVFALLGILMLPLPFSWRYPVVHRWTDISLWWLEHCCGLKWSVTGTEHIPAGPAIIMCKHQSAWETMGLQQIFPPQVWVLKRELLWLPFFGWGLAALSPIAIDRGSVHRALRQTVRQGGQRLRAGIWVVVFPEGTRVAPGEHRRYQAGGGLLATETGYPVVPVAHNAGRFWSRNSVVKQPGTIQVVVGPVIEPQGKTASEVTRACEQWIEATANDLLNNDLLNDVDAPGVV